MKVNLLHIGMMKTATTYMQNVWRTDTSYCTSIKSTIPLIGSLRNCIENDMKAQSLNVKLQIDEPYLDGQHVVMSNEGFSTAFLNSPVSQNKIPSYIDISSRVLGNLLSSTPNLLIVVREPLSWIKSVFSQSISEGGYLNADEFVLQQADFINYSLDVEHIVSCYQRYFKNILLLPLELLSENEDLFWKVISDRFGVIAPSEKLDKVHESLNIERLYLLSILNRLSNFLITELNSFSGYTEDKLYANEIGTMNNNYYLMDKWVHRRFVEFGSDDAIKRAYHFFKATPVSEGFYDFHVSRRLRTTIQDKFITFLRDHNLLAERFLLLYEEKLNNAI